jgi:hypothetical protein
MRMWAWTMGPNQRFGEYMPERERGVTWVCEPCMQIPIYPRMRMESVGNH